MQIENNGENIEVSKKYAKKITRDEMDAGDKKADRKAIFDSMDTNKDGNLTTTELADAFSKLDADGDGKVTDAEINAAVDAIPNIKQAKKAEYIAYLKDMAAKNNSKAETENGNTYTVQLGEQYDDLIKRILKSRGIENPTEEQMKVAKKQFEADNEGAFTRNADGSVKWLLAGKQVFVRTGTADDAKDYMKDRNNASDVEEDYKNWVKGGKKGFTYDASKPNAYRELQKASSNSSVTIDESKFANDENKDKIKERLKDGADTLKQFAENANELEVEESEQDRGGKKYDAKTFKYKDKTVKVLYHKDSGKIKEVWIDADGKSNGVKQFEVALMENGSTSLWRENNDSSKTSKTAAGTVNFDEVIAIVDKMEKGATKKTKDAAKDTEATSKKDSKKQYSQTEIDNIADGIYAEADTKSGGNAVKGMYEKMKAGVNADNVVEVYKTYQKRHTDDDSMITTMTSEWLGYGKGHGRDIAVQATTYILDLLIKRADMAGVDKNSQAYKDVVSGIDTLKNSAGVQKWINNKNKDSDTPKWDIYDASLSGFAEKIIDPLLKEIEKSEK